jgi:hypothetical protein
MPTIYCDHNFIATALQQAEAYRNQLRDLATGGTVTFVLSPMHWVDAAEDRDVARGNAKADFMDSLQPRWLFDRRSIQRKEVTSRFYQFLGINCDAPQIMGDIADVIFDLTGQRGDRSSRAFVNHFRGIGQNHPLEQSIRQAFVTNNKNIELFRRGKLTPTLAAKVERLYIRQLLPARTPAGLVIEETTKGNFARQTQLDNFPAVAIENRATRDNWKHKRPLSRNNFVDQQHIIALPYADHFLTDDKKLRSLITRISASVPFHSATLVKKAEFDNSYL